MSDFIDDYIQEHMSQANNQGGEMPNGTEGQQAPVNQTDGGEGEMPNQVSEVNTENTTDQQSGGQQSGDGSADNPGDDGNQQVDQTPTTQFDWKQFEEKTGGLVKDEESLLSIVDKAKNLDLTKEELETLKNNQFKPANDFVSKLNEFTLQGPNKDQLSAFLEVNLKGDLSSMDAKEILVTKEMLLNGASREVAEYKVDTAYDFAMHDEGSVEYKALQHQQNVDSRSALQELEKYKADISTVQSPEKEAAEQQRLQDIANETQRMNFVKQEAPKLAQAFTGKLSVDLGDNKKFEHNFSDSFKSKVQDHTIEFFEKTKLPLNQESLNTLADYLETKYISENRNEILKDMENKLRSQITEELSSKYENRSGVPNEVPNPSNSFSGNVKPTQKEIMDAAAKEMGI